MSFISPANPADINNPPYSVQVPTQVNIQFTMVDSATASGNDPMGMAIPGKHIRALYSIRSVISNMQTNISPNIQIGNIRNISQTDVFSPQEAQTIWDRNIAPFANRATLDLNNWNVIVPQNE